MSYIYSSNLYYEKRIITDVRNNTFPIWEVYKELDFERTNQIAVFSMEDDFKHFCRNKKVVFKKYSNNGVA